MQIDNERVERIVGQLKADRLDGFICHLPVNVLMLTGYWPVVGTSVGVVNRDGESALIIPEDEAELAERSWIQDRRRYRPATLDRITSIGEALMAPVGKVLSDLGLAGKRIGYEADELSEPSSYAALYLPHTVFGEIVRKACPSARPVPADTSLNRLRLVKTPLEIEHIRASCGLAEWAFERAAESIRDEATEAEVVARFRSAFSTHALSEPSVSRADSYAFCMSGPNAAEASAAFQRTRSRRLMRGDDVLVHCNSYADGYWTDITRTYCLGEPSDEQQVMYNAIIAAKDAALAAIQPGVRAAEIDQAARDVMRERGFGEAFSTATGHGVGFGAIDHNAMPRLHPKSPDMIETGMVFNVEPGAYFPGRTGSRLCNMVAVTPAGIELLTRFQNSMSSLLLREWGG